MQLNSKRKRTWKNNKRKCFIEKRFNFSLRYNVILQQFVSVSVCTLLANNGAEINTSMSNLPLQYRKSSCNQSLLIHSLYINGNNGAEINTSMSNLPLQYRKSSCNQSLLIHSLYINGIGVGFVGSKMVIWHKLNRQLKLIKSSLFKHHSIRKISQLSYLQSRTFETPTPRDIEIKLLEMYTENSKEANEEETWREYLNCFSTGVDLGPSY